MYQEIIKKHQELYLNEEEHIYSLLNSDIKFKSVTEFIGSFFNPFDELKIANQLVNNVPKYKHLTSQELLQDWENRRNRGTIVHKEIETFLNNQCINDNNDIDLKSKQGIKFLNQKCIKDSNMLFSEIKIFSEKLQIAGTIDLMIYNKTKNHISLIDWKTNLEIKKQGYKKGIAFPVQKMDDCSFNKYTLQLSMYQYLLELIYNVKVNGLYIIHLKDHQYNLIECDFQKGYIENMLNSI